MAKINHEKLNYLQRGRASAPEPINRVCFEPPLTAFPKLTFGKRKGVSIPAVFFLDQKYFQFLLTVEAFDRWGDYGAKMKKQVRKIYHLGKRVRLQPRNSDTEFALVIDGAGRFKALKAIRLQARGVLEAGDRIVWRGTIFSAVDACSRFSQESADRLMMRLKEILFEDEGKLSSNECCRFFTKQNNFNAEVWQLLSANGN